MGSESYNTLLTFQKVSPSEIGITPTKLFLLAKAQAGISEILADEQIALLVELFLKSVLPEVELHRFKSFEVTRGELVLNSMRFRTGNIINSHLVGAEGIVLFFATIGEKISFEINRLQSSNEQVEAFLIDFLASESVERVIDYFQNKFATIFGMQVITGNRVSPGYCGWDVSEQQKLFSLVDDIKIGIKLTESSLMIPIKSISGLWGFGEKFKKKEYNCNKCEEAMCYKKFR